MDDKALANITKFSEDMRDKFGVSIQDISKALSNIDSNKQNTPQETYTFSRELHLICYGGIKMGLYDRNPHEAFYVENNTLYRSIKTNGEWDLGWTCNGLL